MIAVRMFCLTLLSFCHANTSFNSLLSAAGSVDTATKDRKKSTELSVSEVNSTKTPPASSKTETIGSSDSNQTASLAVGDQVHEGAIEGGKKKRRRRRRRRMDDEEEANEESVLPDAKETAKVPPTENGSLDDGSSDAPTKKKTTARDKFRNCENCQIGITDRIRVCSGCKKVAYCNAACQKTHWKTHKKVCSYAVQKSELTG